MDEIRTLAEALLATLKSKKPWKQIGQMVETTNKLLDAINSHDCNAPTPAPEPEPEPEPESDFYSGTGSGSGTGVGSGY